MEALRRRTDRLTAWREEQNTNKQLRSEARDQNKERQHNITLILKILIIE